MFKLFLNRITQYSFIIFSSTIFLFFFDNTFAASTYPSINVKIEKKIDQNFSREKEIKNAFKASFQNLLDKIIKSNDKEKLRNIKLDNIRRLVYKFEIEKENYLNNNYYLKINFYYNKLNVNNYLRKQNISFSNPKKTSVLFLPVLKHNNEIKLFEENIFYNQWFLTFSENNLIDYILPLQDLEEVKQIVSYDDLATVDMSLFSNKYNTQNSLLFIAILEEEKKELTTFLKANLENNLFSKKTIFKLNDINNKKEIDKIIITTKENVLDHWKKINKVELIPFKIILNFQNKNLLENIELENTFSKIDIIEDFKNIEFNIEKSSYLVSCNTTMKKLKEELLNYNYTLVNKDGIWFIKKNV